MLTFKRRSVKNQNEMRVFIFKVFNKKQVDMFCFVELRLVCLIGIRSFPTFLKQLTVIPLFTLKIDMSSIDIGKSKRLQFNWLKKFT